ncbi:hypothetical protein ATANTOWER_017769 [Ataeniobius toweri]|uniref:Uncharacterized protein n=1 Tax=Ataeniobius toweri TaxID=208326 RepID=A0ABU7AJW7_9TELE|nr:hypothetical protein [Ataeniobius toweri]
MCECTDLSSREGECVCFQRFPLSCSTSQSDSSSNSRLLCSLLNCGENPPGADSHVDCKFESAVSPPLGLLHPLYIQISIQTLQTMLRPAGSSSDHTLLSNA